MIIQVRSHTLLCNADLTFGYGGFAFQAPFPRRHIIVLFEHFREM